MGMYEIDTYNDESDPSPDIDMLQFFKQGFLKKKIKVALAMNYKSKS